MQLNRAQSETIKAIRAGHTTTSTVAEYLDIFGNTALLRISKLIRDGLVVRGDTVRPGNLSRGYHYHYSGNPYTPKELDDNERAEFSRRRCIYPALDMFVDVNHADFIQPPQVVG